MSAKTSRKTPKPAEEPLDSERNVVVAVLLEHVRGHVPSDMSMYDLASLCVDALDERMADVKAAKAAFDAHRSSQEALGMEVCMVVVGCVTGRDPFRLLSRVAADTGLPAMPDPPLTMAEMQDVAFAAKMAFAKALTARRKKARK